MILVVCPLVEKKYLPSANEFTPNIIDLEYCLSAANKCTDPNTLRENLRAKYFSGHAATRTDSAERHAQQMKLAGNVLIGMRNYKLVLDSDLVLTGIGQKILDNPANAKGLLAKHLIESLCGQEVLLAMQELASRSISRRNKKELADALNALGITTKRGLPVSQSTTDHTKFATWMNWCGLLDDSDEVIEVNYTKFIGKPSNLVSKLWSLTDEQFLFLQFVWQRNKQTSETQFRVKDLLSGARTEFGEFVTRPDQVAANILGPLQDAGFLSTIRSSKGRGGNSGSVKVENALTALEENDFESKNDLYSDVPRVDKSLDDIFSDLTATDTHVKGIALEELAIHMGGVLGLRFVDFRSRSADTGGAEVDVVFDKIGVSYSKWLVQCKNTPTSLVHVSTIAKEVGNALLASANVILIITTGRFSQPARTYADTTIQKSNICVLLLDGEDLENYQKHGDAYLIRKIIELNSRIPNLRLDT